MLGVLLGLAPLQSGVSADINRCLQRLGIDTSFRVQIQASQIEYGKNLVQTLDFSKTGRKGIRYDLVEPIQNRWDRQHQTIFLYQGKATVIDRVTQSYLALDIPQLPDPVQSVRMAGLNVPEPVAFFMNPENAAGVLKPLAASKGWKSTKVGSSVRYTLRQGTGKSSTLAEVRVGKKGMLEELTLKDKNREIRWKIRDLGAPLTAVPTLPKRAVKVTSFVERLAPPKWQDSTARKYGPMAFGFLDRLVDARIVCRDDQGVARVTVAGAKISEEQMQYAWAFNGNRLTVAAHTNKLFGEGMTSSNGVVRSLQRMYIEPKLLTRRLIVRENFLRMLLPTGAAVRSIGSMKLAGEDVAMLEANVDNTRIQMSVRKKDGALIDLTSRTLDKRGKMLLLSRYGFQFTEVGKPQPDSAFVIKPRKGYRAVALSPSKG